MYWESGTGHKDQGMGKLPVANFSRREGGGGSKQRKNSKGDPEQKSWMGRGGGVPPKV